MVAVAPWGFARGRRARSLGRRACRRGAPAQVAAPPRAIGIRLERRQPWGSGSGHRATARHGSRLGRRRPWGSAQVSTPPPRRASPAAAAIPWPELLKLDADGLRRCWSVADEADLVATVATRSSGLEGGSPAWEGEGVAGSGEERSGTGGRERRKRRGRRNLHVGPTCKLTVKLRSN